MVAKGIVKVAALLRCWLLTTLSPPRHGQCSEMGTHIEALDQQVAGNG